MEEAFEHSIQFRQSEKPPEHEEEEKKKERLFPDFLSCSNDYAADLMELLLHHFKDAAEVYYSCLANLPDEQPLLE